MNDPHENVKIGTVAVLGAGGTMGGGMARNAAAAGLSVRAVAGNERCAALARDRGLRYVDAPVLGSRQPAEEGTLVVLASGRSKPRTCG